MGFFDAFSEIGRDLYGMIWYFVAIIPIIGLIFFFITKFRNKAIFKYPVRIFKIRENEGVKEVNVKGGYIKRKGSASFFRIKTGKWWWQYIDLITTPNPNYMDEEDRVYYKQIDVDTYVQQKRKFTNPDEINYSPVESDVKYGAILSINRIREITGQSDKWKTIVAWAALFFVGAILLVGYALLLNTKCPAAGG